MDKRLVLIFLIILIDVIVGTSLSPVTPKFVENMSNPSFYLAVGAAFYTGMQLFTAPVLGVMSDRIGRRPIFILSAIGTLLFNLIMLPMHIGLYYANRLGDGATNGMYTAIRSAITDISSPKDLFRNMGYEGSIASIGVILGPTVSSVFLAFAGYDIQSVILVAAALALLNVGLCFILPETHNNLDAERQPLRWAEIRPVLMKSLNVLSLVQRVRDKAKDRPAIARIIFMQFFLAMCMGYYFYYVNYLSLGALQMDSLAVSYNFIFFGVVNAFASFVFFTFIADKLNKRKAVQWFALLGVGVHLWYANVGSSVLMIYLVTVVDCFTISYIPGLLEGVLAGQTTDDDRGEIFGLSQALASFGSFTTTLIFAGLSLITPELPFYWFAFCLLVVFVLALQLGDVEAISEDERAAHHVELNDVLDAELIEK